MASDGIMTATREVAIISCPGEWPSGKATDFELRALPGNGSRMKTKPPETATGIDWAFAPEWLTIEEACFLSGHDRGTMLSIIEEGGVDLNVDGLIEKQSLWDYQVTLAEVLHGEWG